MQACEKVGERLALFESLSQSEKKKKKKKRTPVSYKNLTLPKKKKNKIHTDEVYQKN
eukprot:NODE_25716_length_577_cov_2.931111.p3 GENE.NODE_25716_length_577_cov_2.931111~~NODE_25716_length_577_cov_2.931111.p3  ORF type:complete len:57 (-),score=26.19 NODE_25716_length_577_cov_2.931111:74-244(-)